MFMKARLLMEYGIVPVNKWSRKEEMQNIPCNVDIYTKNIDIKEERIEITKELDQIMLLLRVQNLAYGQALARTRGRRALTVVWCSGGYQWDCQEISSRRVDISSLIKSSKRFAKWSDLARNPWSYPLMLIKATNISTQMSDRAGYAEFEQFQGVNVKSAVSNIRSKWVKY